MRTIGLRVQKQYSHQIVGSYGYEEHWPEGTETVHHQIVGMYGYEGHWPESTEIVWPLNSGNVRI